MSTKQDNNTDTGQSYYSVYLNYDTIKLSSAICLLLRINPRQPKKAKSHEFKSLYFEVTNLALNAENHSLAFESPTEYMDYSVGYGPDEETFKEVTVEGHVKPKTFFIWVESKGYKIPVEVTEFYSYKKSKKIAISDLQHKLVLDPEMMTVLEPIIRCILDFKDCPDYRRYGNTIQQGIIGSWLKSIGLKSHRVRHLKELITSYYKIKVVNK